MSVHVGRDFTNKFNKGRFTSVKSSDAKSKRSEEFSRKWSSFREERKKRELLGAGNITCTKRRIVELAQLATDLWCSKCKVPISLRDLISEEQHGLALEMIVKCWKCETNVMVKTAKPSKTKRLVYDVNCKLATGMYDSGMGVDPINTLLSALNIPKVSQTLLKRHERYVGHGFLQVAEASCAKNIELEKRLTEEAALSLYSNSEPIESRIGQESLSSLSLSLPSSSSALASSTPLLVSPDLSLSINTGSSAIASEISILTPPDSSASFSSLMPKSPSPKISPYPQNMSSAPQSTPVSDDTPVSERGPPAKKSKIECKVSGDAAWQKKGSGHSYNSKSGHATLFGHHSKKIIAFDYCSARCRKCEAGHPRDDHECPKNHDGSAKSMEPAMMSRMVNDNNQFQEAGIVIGTFIGDDDASTIHEIRRNSEIPVDKWSDINHAEKSFSKGLYTNAKVPKALHLYFRRSFAYAITTNKGNPAQLKADLNSIPFHAFGDHKNCGNWCGYLKNPSTYEYKSFKDKKPLQDPDLQVVLMKELHRFIENAEKIAPCGSTQVNENINNLMTYKHPKNRHYAGSESLVVRLASTVAHNSEGTAYIVEVNKALALSPGDETIKVRAAVDRRRERRAVKQKTREFKRQRLFLKNRTSSKAAAQEEREGITYSTDCGLDGIAGLIDDPPIRERICDDGPTKFVYFDLETTGLSKLTCEILQIGAKSQGDEFQVNILPKKGIPSHVSNITGLTMGNGQLFRGDQLLITTPIKTALLQFIEFLTRVGGNSVVLIAHNGHSFDAPIILRTFKTFELLEQFSEVVKGFADSLEFLKISMPERKESFKLTTLAEHFGIDSSCAHDALADVRILAKVVEAAAIEERVILRHSKTIAAVIRREKNLATKKMTKEELTLALKPAVSQYMISRMADQGISVLSLESAFQRGGRKAVEYILSESVNNKARVTAKPKIVQSILNVIEERVSKK